MKLKYVIATLSLSLLITPALQAKDGKGDKAEKQAKILAKFDTNHNGVLDPDEQAALDKFNADKKAKREKKAKKSTPQTSGTTAAPAQ